MNGPVRALMILCAFAVAAAAPARRGLVAPGGGFVPIGDLAVAYVPAKLKAPVPVLVLLHGSGGGVESLLRPLMSAAAARGLVLLAIKSKDSSWRLASGDFVPSRVPDGDRLQVDGALDRLGALLPIDPKRTGIAGFSDGASLALSLGMAEPERYRFVAALSPGVLVNSAATASSRGQRVVIAHAPDDQVLPFRRSRDDFCRALNRDGRLVRFIPFRGGHRVDPAVLAVALDDFLAPATRPVTGNVAYRCPGDAARP